MQSVTIKLNLKDLPRRGPTIRGPTIYLYTEEHIIIPRENTGVFGSTMKEITINQDISYYGKFYVRKNRVIAVDRKGQRCSKDGKQVPFGRCMVKNLEEAYNCTSYQLMANRSREFCSILGGQLGPYNKITENKYKKFSEANLVNLTGCLPSCDRFEISLDETKDIHTWPHPDPTMMLVFQFEDGTYDVREEYIVYDTSNFIADVGGYLGLLMGHSILSIYYLCTGWLAKMKVGRYHVVR